MTKISRGNSEEKYNSVFATRLRLLFDEKPNVTQAQLSEKIGVTRQTVSQYVNGISEPGYAALVKIADFFDVSLDYLLGRTETKSADLDIKDVCAITGLDEHSIEVLQSINACSENDAYGITSALGRNLGYAPSLVNEFIDFALAPKENRSLPVDRYLSFRRVAAQCQDSGDEQRRVQLSTEKKAEITARLSSVGLTPFPPKEAAEIFCKSFCNEFYDYLMSKYPTKVSKSDAKSAPKTGLSVLSAST